LRGITQLHIDGSQDGFATWKSHTDSLAETLLIIRNGVYRMNEYRGKALLDLENLQQIEMAKLHSIQDQADTKMGYLSSTIQSMNVAIREVNHKAEHAAKIRATGGGMPFKKGAMEYKSVQRIKPLTGDKAQVRKWHQTSMSALAQVNPEYGEVLKKTERESYKGKRVEDIASEIMSEYPDCDQFRADLYCVLMDKAEG
jgi:hypothetical protein